jgi:esterase
MSAASREIEAGGLQWRVFGSWASGDTTTTPLVVLHGLFGSGDNWRSHAEALSEDRPVLVPDMPNHGRSLHTDDMDFRSIARYVWSGISELSDSLSITASTFALLGHSMGGKAAMAMAFQEPQRTARIISADIAPREYVPSHGEIFEAMEAVAAATVNSRNEADRIMAQRIPAKAVRLFLLKSLVRDEESGEYRWLLNVEGLRASYDEVRGWPFREERYDGPALFIAGGDSPYIGPGDGDAISRHFPAYDLKTIPDVGHWLHVEDRQVFLELVTGFLS